MSYASTLAAFVEADRALAEARHLEGCILWGRAASVRYRGAVSDAHGAMAKAHRSLALLIRTRLIRRLRTRRLGHLTTCLYRTTSAKLEAWSAWADVGVGMMDRTVEIVVRMSLRPAMASVALIACFDLNSPIGMQLDAAADAVKRVPS